MEENLDAVEWARWVDFHALYDLPDAYLVAGQLGALIANIMGNKARPHDFAPYYTSDAPPPPPRPTDPDAPPSPVPLANRAVVEASKAFVRSCVKPRRPPDGKQVPQP